MHQELPELLEVTKMDIEKYLEQIKKLICKGQFRIDRNRKRPKNAVLFDYYVITEEDAKNILLDLNTEDFSHMLKNGHMGFGQEILYVFGKEIELLRRYEEANSTSPKGMENLELYIKFNKIEIPYDYLIVISFHIGNYSLNYPFKP